MLRSLRQQRSLPWHNNCMIQNGGWPWTTTTTTTSHIAENVTPPVFLSPCRYMSKKTRNSNRTKESNDGDYQFVDRRRKIPTSSSSSSNRQSKQTSYRNNNIINNNNTYGQNDHANNRKNINRNVEWTDDIPCSKRPQQTSTAAITTTMMMMNNEIDATIKRVKQNKKKKLMTIHPLMMVCTKPSQISSLHPAVRLAVLHDEVRLEFQTVRDNTNIDPNIWH